MESHLVPQQREERGPTISFLKTPSGVLMVVNFFMLMICWGIIATWKGNVADFFIALIKHETGYFLFSTVFPWLIYIIFFIILILRCDNQISNVNWPLLFLVNCVLWGFLLFIASCVLAGEIKGCKYPLCEKLQAATVFGFLSTITLALQAWFHYREHKAAKAATGYPPAGAV